MPTWLQWVLGCAGVWVALMFTAIYFAVGRIEAKVTAIWLRVRPPLD